MEQVRGEGWALYPALLGETGVQGPWGTRPVGYTMSRTSGLFFPPLFPSISDCGPRALFLHSPVPTIPPLSPNPGTHSTAPIR